jgi:hypothetical protein
MSLSCTRPKAGRRTELTRHLPCSNRSNGFDQDEARDHHLADGGDEEAWLLALSRPKDIDGIYL